MSNDHVNGSRGSPVTELSFDQRLQNVKFDLVAATILSSTNALERMKVVLKQIYDRRTPSSVSPSDGELSVLFSDAWSIIYNLNMLRRTQGPEFAKAAADGANLSELCQQLEIVRKVRNAFEHIDAKRIAAKIKKVDFPILGVIGATYFNQNATNQAKIRSLDHILLSHSSFHQPIDFEPVPVNITSFIPPVDHVRLFAFSNIIDLSRIVVLAKGASDVLDVRQLNPPDSGSRFAVILREIFDPPRTVSIAT